MHAAVNGKDMTRDVTPHIGNKKINGIGDIFGIPEPVYRYLFQKLLRTLSARKRSVMSVSMKPGATALTVMFLFAYSLATALVNPMIPALLAQ